MRTRAHGPRPPHARIHSALVAVTFGLALPASWASAARGEGSAPVALEWVAPDACPDGAYVMREVERLVGESAASERTPLRARAKAHRTASGTWQVEVRTAGPHGEGLRILRGESCGALADATALTLALAIDPERVVRGGAPSDARVQALPPAAAATPTPSGSAAAPKPTPVAAPPERGAGPVVSRSPGAVRFALGVSGTLDTGTLPNSAPGVALSLGATPRAAPALRLEVGGGLFLDQSATASSARSGTFALRTVHAGACVGSAASALEVGVCAAFELAWVSAAGLHEIVTTRGDAVWPVVRAGATAAWRLSPAWAIRADIGAGLDVTRPAFVAAGDPQGLIHQPARVTGRGGLGIELRF